MTNSYALSCKEFVKRHLRCLKQFLMLHKVYSFEVRSLVWQGIRNTVREDLVASVAHLTFGTFLRIPGQLYENISLLNPSNYITKLQKIICVESIHSSWHIEQNVYVPKGRDKCSLNN